jgi:hypothetical protein
MQPSRLAIASAVAIAVMAGCGSADKTASIPATTSALNASSKLEPAFIARVDAVCARATKGAVPFPYRNFDPTHPDVKLLPKVGAFLAKRQTTADAVPHQLRELGQPTTGRPIWAQMLGLATRERAIADRQIKAAETVDVHGFVTTLAPTREISNQLRQLAKDAGFSSSSPCGMIF